MNITTGAVQAGGRLVKESRKPSVSKPENPGDFGPL